MANRHETQLNDIQNDLNSLLTQANNAVSSIGKSYSDLYSAISDLGYRYGNHSWETGAAWSWAGSAGARTSATATIACSYANCPKTVTKTDSSLTYTDGTSTCTSTANRTYTASVTHAGNTYTGTKVDTGVIPINSSNHNYNANSPSWSWTGYTAATATYTCTRSSSHKTTQNATITNKVITAATCSAAGTRTYTASVTFQGVTKTSQKTQSIAMLNHTFNTTPSFSWADDYSWCDATFTCSVCSQTQTKECSIDFVDTAATCLANKYTTYTATVTHPYNSNSYTNEIIEAYANTQLSHIWGTYTTNATTCTASCTRGCGTTNTHSYVTGTPTWAWTNYTSATATFPCATCSATSSSTKVTDSNTDSTTSAATCTSASYTYYTASVSFKNKTYTNQKSVWQSAALGHDITGYWNTAPNTEADYTGTTPYADYYHYCTRCTAFGSSSNPNIAGADDAKETSYTPATCSAEGVAEFSASVVVNGTTKSTTWKVTFAKLAHTYGNYSSISDTQHQRTCSECSAKDTGSHSFGSWYEAGDTYSSTCAHKCTVCDKVVTSEHTSLNGWYYYNEDYEYATCGRCGGRRYDPHGWGDWETVTAATCTEAGERKRTCSYCGSNGGVQTEPISALGHDYSKSIPAKAATCTNSGYTAHKECSRCGAKNGDYEIINALGHASLNYTANTASTHNGVCSRCNATVVSSESCQDWEFSYTVDPTCDSDGYDVYTCGRCNTNTITDNPTSALGHSYGAWTWYDNDWETSTCSRCNDVKWDGHNFGDWTTTTAPTCTSSGEESRTCSWCHGSQSSTLDALGHDYSGSVTSATCTSGGYTTYTCSRCGDSYTDDKTDALGHNYQNAYTQYGTCVTPGYITWRCSRCGDIYDENTGLNPNNHESYYEGCDEICYYHGSVN